MLKQTIQETGYTQEEACKLIDVSFQGLQNIFNNKSENTRAITCINIYKYFKLMPWQYLNVPDLTKINTKK